MTRLHGFIGLLSLSLAVVACNKSEEGDQGNLLFTPQNCGWLAGCDFAAGVAVGGEIQVHIDPAMSGVSTAGLDLDTTDANVFVVEGIPDVGGQPTWLITGTGEGVASLIAFDPQDSSGSVDSLEVGVQELDGLRLEDFIGDAVGPTSDATYDEIWTVNADQQVSFQVIPTVGAGDIMGDMQYTVTVDAGLAQYMLAAADISGGYFDFSAPAGTYEVDVIADNGAALLILFDVQ